MNYTHTLSNNTDSPLTFDVVARSSMDWPLSLCVQACDGDTLFLPVELGAGENVVVTATLQVPTKGGEDTTVVTATALGYPALWATVTDVTSASATVYLPLVLRGQ